MYLACLPLHFWTLHNDPEINKREPVLHDPHMRSDSTDPWLDPERTLEVCPTAGSQRPSHGLQTSDREENHWHLGFMKDDALKHPWRRGRNGG